MNIDELYDIISQNVQFYRMNNLKYGHITKEKLSKFSLTALNHIAKALDISFI